MMNIASIWAIAIAEMRTSRRLVRTWVFIVLASLTAIGQFLNLTMTHAMSSSVSASAGLMGPRFLMGAAAGALLLVFQFGIVFLAFDVRSRDMRDRIAGVIDSRPFTNLELLIGRLTGITLLLAIPSALLVVLIAVGSYLLAVFEAPFGDTIEPYSVLSFLILDLLPNLSLWGALTIFFAVLLRLRLIVALLMLGLVIGYFTMTTQLPGYLVEAVAFMTSVSIYPSDLAPQFANATVLWQRLALILIIAGLLTLSAMLYPRPDGQSKLVMMAAGTGCLIVGLGIVATLVQNMISAGEQFDRLASVHEQHYQEPRADIVHLSGDVRIDPGDELETNYEIAFRAPSAATNELLFAFNPGFEISSASLNGEPALYQFEDGLIRLQFNGLDPNDTHLLSLNAKGYPDMDFGYFDSKLNVYSATVIEGQALALLGFENAVFHDKYVALTPAIKWYPTAGSAYGEDDYENTPRDQFTIDLEVTVPNAWTVAGPGSRETLAAGNQTKYRFAPQATVPEVGLFGSRFVRHSKVIAGVEFELLFSPKHTRNLELFGDVVPVLEEEIGAMVEEAETLGIPYPYEMFSIVEVPTFLRTYGGGWRMDSIHALPGIMMIRESGFPTARFENRLEPTKKMLAEEDYKANLQYELLDTYFENDVSGGNPYITASRNFMNYQTYPTGKGADALAYVTNALVSRVIPGRTGFFSIYFAGDQGGMQMTLGSAMMVSGFSDRMQRFSQNLRNTAINRPSVWEGVISTPLSDVNLHADPKKALNVITLKGEAVAASLNDALSSDDIGRLLGALRTRYAGGSYTFNDFQATAEELQIDIESIIGDWLNERELPGFQIYEPNVVRLPDDSLGVPEYQTTFYLSNEEPVPGLVSITFEERRRGESAEDANKIPALRVPANSYSRIALHSEYSIERISVHPYLSLNREPITVDVDEPDSWDPQPLEKLPLMAAADWRPPEHEYIVVDDLDDGFFLTGNVDRDPNIPGFALWMMRTFMGGLLNYELDQGLPALGVAGATVTGEAAWYRESRNEAWGMYRHTTATALFGSGDAEANFRTKLSNNGRWQLEYHFPHNNDERRYRRMNRQAGAVGFQVNFGAGRSPSKNYSIKIKDGEREIPVEFDASIAAYGWNRLGEFLLKQQEVDVAISNGGSGVIFADAIRWTPIARTN